MAEQRTRAGGLGERLLAVLQYPLPHRLLSDIVGWATRLRVRWFKDFLIRTVVRRFNVVMDEAVETDPCAYPSFNAFFTRALRDGARPIATAGVACPVDGGVSEAGTIDGKRLLQAKGHHYRVSDLLTGGVDWAARFTDGAFATLYLSPRDYHRVHMPCDGTLVATAHVPGRLFSVAPFTVRQVPGLFARNERLVCLFEGTHGPFAVILVGAMLVSSLSTVWAGDLKRARRGIAREEFAGRPVSLSRGDELGRFNMGSTVILLFPKNHLAWHQDLRAGATVRMGQPIASFLETDGALTGRQPAAAKLGTS